MTRVKVCGITSPDAARAASAAGASAIGMVFWPDSPRVVTVAQARAIVATLPPFVAAVGVFVNAARAHVDAVAHEVGLDAIQLHGDERTEDWQGTSRPIIKALTLGAWPESRWPGVARAILLDAHDPVRRGGTGRQIDWDRARDIAQQTPIVLAGGLTAANVADAIARVRPAALDVSSGVERAPGVKDPERLRAFFAAVRGADHITGAGTASAAERTHS